MTRISSRKALLIEFRRRVAESERVAMERLDGAGSQDQRWAIHAEHVQERIALTLEFLDQLPLDVAADQVDGLRKALREHEREFARTGGTYHQGSVELFARLIAACEKRLEERKAEAGSPSSA